MTRQQALNYLYSSGMSDEQVSAVVEGIGTTITIDGKTYIAKNPRIKTIAKDGECSICGFYEVVEE